MDIKSISIYKNNLNQHITKKIIKNINYSIQNMETNQTYHLSNIKYGIYNNMYSIF